MNETEYNICLDYLVLISLCVHDIVGEDIIKHQKNLELKILQCVKTTVSNANLAITENQLENFSKINK